MADAADCGDEGAGSVGGAMLTHQRQQFYPVFRGIVEVEEVGG